MIFFYTSHRLTASFGVMLYMSVVTMMGGYMTCRAHCDPAYSHDDGNGNFFANWMASLPDDIPLSAISWPGTHDSMARFAGDGGPAEGDYVICQSKDSWAQFQQGVRALDVRGRYDKIDQWFPIYHGNYYQNTDLHTLVMQLINYLKKHPKEVIFLLFKHDERIDLTTDEWKVELDFLLGRYSFRDYIARPKDVGFNPKLSQVRGKIFFVVRATDRYYDTSLFNVQDVYNLSNNWDLYNKWGHVKGQMIVTRGAGDKNTKYYVNYLSGSSDKSIVYPYFVASGHSSDSTCAPRLATGRVDWIGISGGSTYPDFPRTTCASYWPVGKWCTISFEGTNTLFRDRLIREPGHTGIVFADFPGDGLIQEIIKQNVINVAYQGLRTHHGTYLRNQPGLNRPLITQGGIGNDEKFLLVDLGNNRCLIQNAHGLRVSAKENGTFSTVFGSAEWEVFRKEYISGSTTVFALKTHHGTYVTAPPGIDKNAYHTTRVASYWERFEVV